jgi:thiol-disulfide isomerase/thioredoxin
VSDRKKHQKIVSFRKPILIEFWATWCGPCVRAFPALEKLYSEVGKNGVTVITIDEDEEAQKAELFFAKRGKPTWTNYHDDGEINRAFPGAGLPQFVLIDTSGRIVYSASGFDEGDIRAAHGKLGSSVRE